MVYYTRVAPCRAHVDVAAAAVGVQEPNDGDGGGDDAAAAAPVLRACVAAT